MRHSVVMVATSYPRFPGDTVGTFMEPIAHGVAARGHDVHMVLPWHPRITRPPREGGVTFHFFRYAPHPSLNVFGYAGGLREDVSLRGAAWLAAPLAMAAGWRLVRRVAREHGATVVHGHWVVPGGVIASYAAGDLPLVLSLHGSDVYVAERNPLVGRIASQTLLHARRVTACSADLRDRALALGAREDRCEVVPYGVDPERFRPEPGARAHVRASLDLSAHDEVIFAAGRFVRKKGFEYLLDAVASLATTRPHLALVLGGAGDLDDEFRQRAARLDIAGRVRFPGLLLHHEMAAYFSAADVTVVPSVRDDAGNVDGLPNVVMEALASGTPLVTTSAGGIGAVVEDGVTARIVPERDVPALAGAIEQVLEHPDGAATMAGAARHLVRERFGWARVAERLEAAYDAATQAP